MEHKIINTGDYLLIVDEDVYSIKNGDYCYDLVTKSIRQWISEDRAFIELRKIISHLPLNNSPILKGVDLLPPLEDTKELNATTQIVREAMRIVSKDVIPPKCVRDNLVKAKEKYKYTEQDLVWAIQEAYGHGQNDEFDGVNKIEESIKVIKTYLQQPKMPVRFKCKTDCCYRCIEGLDECNPNLLTTTNSQGFTQWVGEWVY